MCGKKHGAVITCTFESEVEVVLGSLKAMFLLYHKFGFLTDFQLGNKAHFGAHHVVVMDLSLLMDELSGL